MAHIEFTLSNACPMFCSYCPQQKYINSYKLNKTKFTEINDFKKMLHNVNHKVKEIYFTGYTEPLTNPNWYEIVKHTIDCGYNTALNTTLFNASYDDILKMTSLNLTIRIHLTDSKNTISEDIYKYFLKNIKHNYSFDTFTEIGKQIKCGTDKISMYGIQSRAGNITKNNDLYIEGPVKCSENRQYSNVILPNGDVYVCCQDFSLTTKLGNILTNTLDEIHNSNNMKEFIKKMNSNEDIICKHCSYARRI